MSHFGGVLTDLVILVVFCKANNTSSCVSLRLSTVFNMADKKTLEHNIPDEVAGKVISMIPFPNLLKARTLSRAWCSAFSANPVSRTFQSQVNAVSAKWEIYCPVYITRDGWVAGYDHVSDRWQKMFTLSYLPNVGRKPKFIRYASSLSGPLLCGLLDAACCSQHGEFCQADIFVTNLITKDWKILSRRPDMEKPDALKICASGAGAYKVMALNHPDPPELKEYSLRLITFQTYDSTQNTWTLMELKLSESILLVYQDATYNKANNKFYVLYRDVLRSLQTKTAAFELMVYDNVNGCSTRIELCVPPEYGLRHIEEFEAYTTGLVECRGDLMVVVVTDPMSYSDDSDSSDGPPAPWDQIRGVTSFFLPSRLPDCSVVIFKVQVETLELIPLALGPPDTIMHAYCDQFICHNDCIYLASAKYNSPVVVYNMRKKKWSTLSPAFDAVSGSFFPFQPGLDPFVTV